ncbi:hypothetical protein SAMN05444050_1913 [Afipia sp. GAS231]|nr:hypothetical protein SAMN05444050_1913 [Afipia sp. GAS231]
MDTCRGAVSFAMSISLSMGAVVTDSAGIASAIAAITIIKYASARYV